MLTLITQDVASYSNSGHFICLFSGFRGQSSDRPSPFDGISGARKLRAALAA